MTESDIEPFNAGDLIYEFPGYCLGKLLGIYLRDNDIIDRVDFYSFKNRQPDYFCCSKRNFELEFYHE